MRSGDTHAGRDRCRFSWPRENIIENGAPESNPAADPGSRQRRHEDTKNTKRKDVKETGFVSSGFVPSWLYIGVRGRRPRLTLGVTHLHLDVPRIGILMSALVLLACSHCIRYPGVGASQSVTRFISSDAPPVEVGRYRDFLRMLPTDDPLAVKAGPLRADIEAHEPVLRKLVRDRLEVKSPLEFHLMYVGRDSVNDRLILRYFARAAVQSEIAGWQAQLVYSLPSLLPVHAYVQAVPLE